MRMIRVNEQASKEASREKEREMKKNESEEARRRDKIG
jgi:hypothetical protein